MTHSLEETQTDPHLPPIEYVAFIIAVAFVLGDLYTTFWGIEYASMTESNPFVRNVIQNYGYMGFAVLKGMLIIGLYGILRRFSSPGGLAACFGVALPHAFATFYNAGLIL